MFCKRGSLRDFAIFAWGQLCWGLVYRGCGGLRGLIGGGGPLARVFSVGIARFFGGACVGGACGRLAASVVACLIFAGPGLFGSFGVVGGGGGFWLCPKLRARRAHAPRLPKFILLVSFSDTLLVVSILDI